MQRVYQTGAMGNDNRMVTSGALLPHNILIKLVLVQWARADSHSHLREFWQFYRNSVVPVATNYPKWATLC
jgi:hypothetical protein